jgi:hypothetical protein
MTRDQLEHVIRAASSIAEDDEIVIIGSQAILGQFPDAPEALLISNEADVFPKNHPERWDLVDGSIGEGSPFHRTFGYYAQGVGEDTATLPRGWRERLVEVRGPGTRGATGLCLEVHDLVLSKYAAGRPKDIAFVQEVSRRGLADVAILRRRLAELPVEASLRKMIEAKIGRDFDGPARA